LRKTIATIGAIMAIQLPLPAAAQTRIAQDECSATYAAGEWELEVFYEEPGFLYDQPGVGYHYEHTPSGFSVIVRVFQDRTMLPGFNLEPLLETQSVRTYFDDIPREPGTSEFESGDYAGELQFAVVDHERGWFWRTTGDLNFGWDALDGRSKFLFDESDDAPQPTSMVRRLAERDSDEFELQLDFQPDGERPRRLRAIPVSTSGMVTLFGRSQDYAGAMMRGCPAAAES
jgi:hypothetical protein